VTTLLIEPVAREPFDIALDAPRFTLWRQGVEVRMSVDDHLADGIQRGLALCGVRATVIDGQIPAPPMLVRALGTAFEEALGEALGHGALLLSRLLGVAVHGGFFHVVRPGLDLRVGLRRAVRPQGRAGRQARGDTLG